MSEAQNRPNMTQKWHKTKENPKKPVETEENSLTKRSKRMKVNCGTALRSRMNIGDRASPDVFSLDLQRHGE